MVFAILLGVAYLIGSLSFGLWLVRAQGVDLRSSGSGNIGATNVLRTSGRLMALIVLVLDAAKGAVAVLLARLIDDDPLVMTSCAVAVVAGHVWPAWARFHGGKGVATTAGAWAVVTPVAVVWSVVIFGCLLATTRYVSAASVAAAVALPIVTSLLDRSLMTTSGALVLAVLITIRHRANLRRLANGTEPRIGTPGVKARRRSPSVG